MVSLWGPGAGGLLKDCGKPQLIVAAESQETTIHQPPPPRHREASRTRDVRLILSGSSSPAGRVCGG